jgi:hypothetical protein
MPQIDFGQAFSNPDKNAPSAWPSAQSGQPEFVRDAPREDKLEEFRVGARFGRSEWANLVFVTVTFVGGLFCAFYFFNGAELLRAGMAWPREFLYSRPSIAASNDVNHGARAQVGAARGGEVFPVGPGFAASAGGADPFSRSAGVMSLPSPSTIGRSGAGAGLPSTATAPNASSPFAQLGFPAPGGDALIQAFNRGVSDLARLSNLDAHRTVVVIQTAVTKVEKRASSRAKDKAERAGNAVTNAAGQKTAQVSTTVGTAQNKANSVVNSANNTAQQMMNNTRSTISNPSAVLGSRSTISNPGVGLGPVHLPVSVGGGRR